MPGGAPQIAIKYCGGCNPVYDRAGIVARLRRDYPQARLSYVSQDENWPDSDVVLVISGCRNGACFEYDDLKGKQGQLVVFAEDDYQKIVDFMDKFAASC